MLSRLATMLFSSNQKEMVSIHYQSDHLHQIKKPKVRIKFTFNFLTIQSDHRYHIRITQLRFRSLSTLILITKHHVSAPRLSLKHQCNHQHECWNQGNQMQCTKHKYK